MSNFNLINFLTENKLTKASVILEALTTAQEIVNAFAKVIDTDFEKVIAPGGEDTYREALEDYQGIGTIKTVEDLVRLIGDRLDIISGAAERLDPYLVMLEDPSTPVQVKSEVFSGVTQLVARTVTDIEDLMTDLRGAQDYEDTVRSVREEVPSKKEVKPSVTTEAGSSGLVYILFGDRDYEGSDVIGVYSSLNNAMSAKDNYDRTAFSYDDMSIVKAYLDEYMEVD